MRNVTLEELLEAGCHFGHQVTRHNPKARDYIFEARDNVHIIDLAKTKEGLDLAAEYVRDLAKRGGTMIILGAKRQAEPVVREQAQKVKDAGTADGIYFVTNRWIGGILTNYSEVSKNFQRLKDLTKFMDTPSEKARFTKKEISLMDKERQKMMGFYWGVQDLKGKPDAIFIIDTHLENLAVREALAMKVTTVGITDTNADPDLINHPIPANDDAVGSIQLITEHIVEAWIEGRKGKATQDEKDAASAKGTTSAEGRKAVEDEKDPSAGSGQDATKVEEAKKVVKVETKTPVTPKGTTSAEGRKAEEAKAPVSDKKQEISDPSTGSGQAKKVEKKEAKAPVKKIAKKTKKVKGK